MDAKNPIPPVPPDIFTTSSAGAKRRATDVSDQTVAKKTIVNHDLSNASMQNVYIHPSLVIGIKQYTDLDKGPFVVHISRSDPDLATDASIRIIKFGQLLCKNNVPSICPDGIKKVGRNKVSVEFTSSEAANCFLDNPILEANKFVASIPNYNITKMGIVRHVPIDLSMDEFANSLVVPNGCGIPLKTRRLNRKVITEGIPSWIPTQTVVITFQGQSLPQRIFLFHTSLQVESYQFPTIQCLNCCRFGHIKSQCRSKPRCFRCAQPHTGDSCNVEETDASCLHCLGHHFASNKSCPEQGRQKAVKILMSQENLSYDQASHRYPRSSRPYAEVVQSSSLPSSLTPSSSFPSQSQSSSRSYKKTVFTSPRPRAPLSKSFDRSAHAAITAEEPSVLPNGFALSQSSSLPQDHSILDALLSTLITIISQYNFNLPSHVAQKLSQISSITKYGPSRSTMEREKPSSQEI